MPADASELVVTEPALSNGDERAELVSRIADSSHFRSAPRLREFLLYISARSIENDVEALTEQQIGIHVFDKPPGYDCSNDSVVRSQARQLRLKLEAYFANDGRAEPTIIRIPKGHYVVAFERRDDGLQPPPSIPEPIKLSPSQVPAISSTRSQPSALKSMLAQRRWKLWLMVAAGVVLVVTSWSLSRRWMRAASLPASQIWSPFLGPDQPLVVFSNALFTGDPASGLRYAQRTDPAASIIDTYTGVGEVAAIHDLDVLFGSHKSSFMLKRSQLVTWDEARTKSLIFIGSPEENLSLKVLPATRDFTLTTTQDSDPSGQSGLLNRHPLAGEQARYLLNAQSPIKKDYALVSLIPGLGPKTWIMMLEGTTTYGTEAAADFVTSPEGSAAIANALRTPSDVVVPFEAALEVNMGGGVPIDTKLMLVHVHRK